MPRFYKSEAFFLLSSIFNDITLSKTLSKGTKRPPKTFQIKDHYQEDNLTIRFF